MDWMEFIAKGILSELGIGIKRIIDWTSCSILYTVCKREDWVGRRQRRPSSLLLMRWVFAERGDFCRDF